MSDKWNDTPRDDDYADAMLELVWDEWVPYLESCLEVPNDPKLGWGLYAAKEADEAWCAYGDNDLVRKRERLAKAVHSMVGLLKRNPQNPCPPLSYYLMYVFWEEDYADATDARIAKLLPPSL